MSRHPLHVVYTASEKLGGGDSFTERGKTLYIVCLSLDFGVDSPYLWSQPFCLQSQVR